MSEEIKKIDGNTTCSSNVLAKLFGLTIRRIQQLTAEGILTQLARNKYKMIDAVQEYIYHIQEKIKASDEDLDLTKERALLTKVQREKAELELGVMKGDLHVSADVEAVMTDMLASFRARVLAIPSSVAPKLVMKEETAHIKEILQAEIHKALKELAEYDAEAFYNRNKDYVSVKDQNATETAGV